MWLSDRENYEKSRGNLEQSKRKLELRKESERRTKREMKMKYYKEGVVQ